MQQEMYRRAYLRARARWPTAVQPLDRAIRTKIALELFQTRLNRQLPNPL